MSSNVRPATHRNSPPSHGNRSSHPTAIRIGLATASILALLCAGVLPGRTEALGDATTSAPILTYSILLLAGALLLLERTYRTYSRRDHCCPEHLRIFISEAPVAIAMFDRSMRYLAVSARWLRNNGLQNDQIIGKSHYDVFPDIPQRWKEVHQRCLNGAVECSDEDLFERANGAHKWVRWEVRPWTAHTDEET